MSTDESYRFHRYVPASGHWYVPSPALQTAVNTALAAEQPLLVAGEPGTGKTTLARSVAETLGLDDVLVFHTRSDAQARDCLYTFDALRRFYDAQVKAEDFDGQKAKEVALRDPAAEEEAQRKRDRKYVTLQPLGEAIAGKTTRVVLIDEIDKAPRDFPNDLLDVIEQMRFEVRETGTPYVSSAGARPIVFISTNNEKQLPDPFLRRCVFHHIDFPSRAELRRIVDANLGALKLEARFVEDALTRFEELRAVPLEKRPATAELLVWLRVLHRAGAMDQVGKVGWVNNYVRALVKTNDDLRTVLEMQPGD